MFVLRLRRLSLALCCLTCLLSLGAIATMSQTVVAADQSAICEIAAANFDVFMQSVPLTKNIIIVGYAGKTETKKDIVLRRLHNAKTYLTQAYPNGPYTHAVDKVITSIGIEKPTQGRLDFYVDGELKLTISFRDNRDLNLLPCYLETEDYCLNRVKSLFYPCIDYLKNGNWDKKENVPTKQNSTPWTPRGRELSYEPTVVELEGTLTIKTFYGPPNYGENPKTDSKEKQWILKLKEPVDVIGDKGPPNDLTFTSVYRVTQMELVLLGRHNNLIGKQVLVKGTLFHAHTGHHHTDVLMEVQSISLRHK